jgi:hypothetical protein
MLTKFYTSIWVVIAFAAAFLFLTGNFTALTAVVFGFIMSGLIFMGMMSVLPASIAHPKPVRVGAAADQTPVRRQPIRVLERLRSFRDDLLSSNGVEIRKPRSN